MWSAVWIGVFVWILADHPGKTLPTVAILAVCAAAWAFPGAWLDLAVGFVAAGVGVGLAHLVDAWVLLPCLAIAVFACLRWWRRVAPRIRLYRSGVRGVGRVVAVDADVAPERLSSETSHTKVRYEVRFRPAAGGDAHTVSGRETFEVGHQPRVRDVVDVYYLPDDADRAVAVFRHRPMSERA